MRCDEFEARWHDLLDERRPPESDAGAEAHLRRCPACRRLAAAQEAAFVGLAQAGCPAAPDDLAHRVLAELRRSKVPRFAGRRRWLAWAAAALIVAVVVPWQRLAVKRPAAGPARRMAQQELGVHPAPTSDAPALGDLAAEAAQPYRLLVRDTSDSLAAALQIVPGMGSEPNSPHPPRAEEQSRAGWVDGLFDGLAPVRKSTTGTLNNFLRVFNAIEEGPRS